MKLERSKRNQILIRAAEAVAVPEDERLLVFNPYDFFSPDDWANLAAPLLKQFEESPAGEPRLGNVELFLNGSFALRFLRPEQLEIIRRSTKVRYLLTEFFSNKTDIYLLTEEETNSAVLTHWLFPDIQTVVCREAWEDLCERAKKNPYPLNKALIFLVDPKKKDELDLDIVWEAAAERLAFEMDADDHADPFEPRYLALSAKVLYPLTGQGKLKVARKMKGDPWLLANEANHETYTISQTSRLLHAAITRVILAEKIEVKDGEFVIQDSVARVDKKIALPPRSEV